MCANSSQSSTMLNATNKNQIKMYFDISHDLLEEFLEKLVCPGFNLSLDPILQTCLYPSSTENTCTRLDVAYGQWSRASVTQINQQASISVADPTILGYPEMSYFLSEVFMKTPN